MKANTFKVIKNNKEYIGSITGCQCRKGYDDKYYLHLIINEDSFSIWFDNWFSKEEMYKCCDAWKIDKDELVGQ